MTKKELIEIINNMPNECDISIEGKPIITEYNGYDNGMMKIIYEWDITILSRQEITKFYKIKNGIKIVDKENNNE